MSQVQQPSLQPHIRAVTSGLFPTLGSLREVIYLADSKLPITNRNELTSLLMIYHNTLLRVVKEQDWPA